MCILCTCIDTYTELCSCMYGLYSLMSACMNSCMHACMHACMQVCTNVRNYVSKHACIRVGMHRGIMHVCTES